MVNIVFFVFYHRKISLVPYFHPIYNVVKETYLCAMRTRITAILLFALLFVSCSKDNDDIINVELEGRWTLTNALCFCGFEPNTDFSTHKITFEKSNLTVANSGNLQFLNGASGNYTVDGNLITLKNGNQYKYVVKGNILELTFVDEPGIADDELFLIYEKS